MVKKEIFNCKKCGKNHKIRECPAYGKKCAACKERNHFATMCHKARQERSEPQEKKSVERVKNKKRVNEVKEQEQEDIEEEKTFYLDTLVLGQLDKVSQLVNLNSSINSLQTQWYQKLKINKEFIQFKLDTGAECNTLPYNYFQKLNKNNSLNLKETKLILTSYSGNKFKPLGSVNLECKLNKNVNKVDFLVVDLNNAVPILGLESCLKFNLLKRVNEITSKETKEQFVSRNKDVFTGLGKIGKYKIKLIGEPEPIIKPIRRVPEAVSHKLKNTLEIMEKKGIIIKVNEPTEWCQNLVIVEKPDKSLRVCLDPKDLNRYIGRERYLIPSTEELCNRLAGKEVFSVLDMKDGFYQIELDEPSSYLCTFGTPFGRYRFKRMPFGISSAPEVLQKANTKIFGDLEGVQIYFDDLIIAGKDAENHDRILQEVINRARKYNYKFNVKKLQYKIDKVKYVGLIISKEGIAADASNVETIVKLEEPKNVKALQKFLGMTNYLSKFIPHYSESTQALRELL
ncbi:uncharacterized protein K02A2.6-like [Sitophilus oryzae]|uniref:Uncharacterized protein K02A2.6-like n=1 Tax=Sitophilus oryzae TaxID=7048 RepID=A0A6J2Y905_SITOR|nr:uncharacterized protein K02A2.6-like [Sitophilus oryzae]